MEMDESYEVLRQSAYSKSPTLEKFLGPVQHPDVWQGEIYKAAEEAITLADKYLGSQTMGIMADFLIENASKSKLFELNMADKKSENYLRMLSAGILVIGWDLADDPDLLGFAQPEVVKKVKSSFGISDEYKGRKVAPVKAYVEEAFNAGRIMKRTFDRVYAIEGPKVIEGTIVREEAVSAPCPDGPIGDVGNMDTFRNAFSDKDGWPIFNDQNQIIGWDLPDTKQHEEGGDYGLGYS